MTTLREAAQQALDALTAHADLHGTMFLKMDAISALRAALAEQDEPVARAVADEREECAKVCEGRIGGAVQTDDWWAGFRSAMGQCAAAIRARSNT